MTRLHEIIAEYLRGAGERFQGYKTHFFAFLVFLLGLLEVVDPWVLSSLLPERWGGALTIGLAVAIYLLRRATTGPDPLTVRAERKRAERAATDAGLDTVDTDSDGGDGD